MLFSRFLQLRDLLQKAKQDEVHEKFTLSAFTAWQQGAGPGLKFSEYLEGLGLSDKQATSVESKELTAKEAIAKAEKIMVMVSKKDKV